MSRPKFTIDKQRLYDLRTEAGKTQLTVAKELHLLLENKHPSTDATLTTNYQRIERLGATSRERANALAKLFGVSIEVLKGESAPEPFHYLNKLGIILREQLKNLENAALRNFHEQCCGATEVSDESIGRLAEAVGERIEAVQFGRNPFEIAELMELTGLSEAELLTPANVLGRWLLIATYLGGNKAEFVYGAGGLVWRIKEIVGNRLDSRGSDGSIRMYRDDPWFRMEIMRTDQRNDLMRIDFVRCNPALGNGFRWAQATWRELFWLEDPIVNWAYSAANFVTDFKGNKAPNDLRKLRFIITKHDGSYSFASGRMVVSGGIEDLNEKIFKSFQKENASHELIQSWLTADLKLLITPYLAAFPAECWSVTRGACVDISLDPRKSVPRSSIDTKFGVRYRIALVEEISESTYSPVPWRDKDMETLRKNLEEFLHNSSDPYWKSDGIRCSFEPFEAEG